MNVRYMKGMKYSMDSFQNRLKISIDRSNLTQSEIARRIGTGRSTISGWLKGDYEPNSENIYKLARLFNVSEAWLLGFVDEEYELRVDINTKKKLEVPLLNVSGGKEVEDYSQVEETVEAPSRLNHYGNDLFAIRVNGDSMNKILPNDSIVICVKAYEEPKTGDIVVYKKENEFAVKRYIKTEQMIIFEPVSFDTSFESIIYNIGDDREIEILGTVKYNFTEFE